MLSAAGPRARVAVVLNRNARGVRPEVVERLGRLVPERDLFVSGSMEDSKKIAEKVIARSYDGVLFGGGDGTFVQCLHDLRNQAAANDSMLPAVGVLRLGTGNALADALGASRPTADGLVRDLRRARGLDRKKTLPLLNVDGKLTPFAGCGLDAQILDDFHKMGALIDRFAGDLAPKIGASARYAIAVGARSVPRFVASARAEVEVVNTGGLAYRIDQVTGRIVEEDPIGPGEVLFRGPVTLCSTATIPYFGLSMKMFPYADNLPGKFQLRFATCSAYEVLRNLPAIFRGEYKNPETLHDFLADGVEMRMAQPTPVQIGGDLQPGRRDSLRVEIADRPIRVLS
jgi:diacylglycerol kinase family enzyme